MIIFKKILNQLVKHSVSAVFSTVGFSVAGYIIATATPFGKNMVSLFTKELESKEVVTQSRDERIEIDSIMIMKLNELTKNNITLINNTSRIERKVNKANRSIEIMSEEMPKEIQKRIEDNNNIYNDEFGVYYNYKNIFDQNKLAQDTSTNKKKNQILISKLK